MNKAELISAMAAESGLSKTDSKKALDAFIASVTKAMKAGDKVSVVGFECGGKRSAYGYQPLY